MSFIQIRDQYGNAPPATGRLDVALTPQGFTSPQDRRFTDDAGNVAFTGCGLVWPDAKGTFRLDVNTANVNPNYGSASLAVSDIEAQVYTIVVQKKGDAVGEPGGGVWGNGGYGTCDEWKSRVFAIFKAHGYSTVGPDNEGQGAKQAPYLRATQSEIQALHPSPFVQWQRESVGSPPELRPRLFLPNPSGNGYARYADLGDWDGPLKWEHCGATKSTDTD